jgi:hypothetical protein
VICRRHNRLYLALDNGLEFVGVVGDFAGHPRFPQPGHYELGEFVFGFGGEVHLPLPLRADRNGQRPQADLLAKEVFEVLNGH